ncbi:hypothetical protein CCMA1212_000529 [Trichoderma ghanense]|uniref:Uncharacterized protein n=1 Tax=Trichoderma ghanense TaxID=65468 RepID=A0ABY2HH82_9HYPO
MSVLLALVAGAEVQQDGANLLALGLLHGAVLHEGAEGRQAGSEARHDERRRVLGRQLHDGGLDGDGDGGTGLQAAEVARGLADARAALGVDPVDDDDHEGDAVGRDGLRRGDGVLAALERADDLDEVVEAGARRAELLEDVDVGHGVDLGAALELGGAVVSAQRRQLLLLSLVGGKLGQGLVEALRGLAEDVDVLRERLEHGADLEGVGVLAGGHLDKLRGVEAVELDEGVDLLLVVLRMDAQGLADLVRETRVAKVELDVEDVTVVVRGRQTAVLLDPDGGGLDRELGTQRRLRAIGLLEDQALGGNLPVLELPGLFGLLLLERNKGIGLNVSGQTGVDEIRLNLCPAVGDLQLGQDLVKSAASLLHMRLCSNERCEVLGTAILLPDCLSHGSWKSLFDIGLVEVWQLDEKLATRDDVGQHVDILEDLFVTNNHGFGCSNGVGRFQLVLGRTNISSDNAALGEVVVRLKHLNVVGVFLGKELAKAGGRLGRHGVIELPKRELLGLDEKRRQRLGLVVISENLVQNVDQALRGQGLSRGVLNVQNFGLLLELAGEGNGCEHIAVQRRLCGLVCHSGFAVDLAEHGNGASRGGDGLEEGFLNEGPVDTNIDDADLGSVSGNLLDGLLGDLSLDASKGNQDDIGSFVSVVFKGLVHSAELVVEEPQELQDFACSVEVLVQLASLLDECVVDIGHTGLAQCVNHSQSLPGQANAVAQAKIFSEPQSNIIVGDEAVGGAVIGGSDMSHKGAGEVVEKGELVQGSTEVLERPRRSQQRLRDMALVDVKIRREDVAQGEGTGTCSSLKGQDIRGVSVNVLALVGSPLLGRGVKAKGGRRVGEDLVGELVRNLLDKQLGRHIRRARDVRQRHLLAKRQGGGFFNLGRHFRKSTMKKKKKKKKSWGTEERRRRTRERTKRRFGEQLSP